MINSALHTVELDYNENEKKRIWIYVPAHKEGERLPVVYMTDGQNLFDEASTAYGSWGVVCAVEAEIKNGSAGAVIVGIDNGNAKRDCELTPDCIGEVQLKELLCDDFVPKGEEFDSFFVNTVLPYVETNFPVRCDKNGRAVCGSSSGGLMSFFSGIEHKTLFGFVGAFSPAFLCYTEDSWRMYLSDKITGGMPYLYIYTGNGDELEQMIFQSVEPMYDLLTEKGYPYDMLNEVVLLENKHNEKAWKEIFPDFLHTFLHNANLK